MFGDCVCGVEGKICWFDFWPLKEAGARLRVIYLRQGRKVIDICLWLALGIEAAELSSYFVVRFETPEIDKTVDEYTKAGDYT